MVDLLAGSVVKLLASLEEGSLVGALVTMAASFVFVIVVSLVVVVVAVVEVVGLVLATLLVFDCEDALPTAIITNKINFITSDLSCGARKADWASSLLLAGQHFPSTSQG